MDLTRPSMVAAGIDVFATARNIGRELEHYPLQKSGVWKDRPLEYPSGRACSDRVAVTGSCGAGAGAPVSRN